MWHSLKIFVFLPPLAVRAGLCVAGNLRIRPLQEGTGILFTHVGTSSAANHLGGSRVHCHPGGDHPFRPAPDFREFLVGGGYKGIPLERNAYILGKRSEQRSTSAFSVANEAAHWIAAHRF